MKFAQKVLHTLFIVGLLVWGGVEVFDIAWGTGQWWGEMALTWMVIVGGYCVAGLAVTFILLQVLWKHGMYQRLADQLVELRRWLGGWRWVLAGVAFVFPVWLLQFTMVGVVLQGLGLRLLLWSMQLLVLAYLLTKQEKELVGWNVFLYVVILTASLFSIFASLREVTGYPFSLGWSEGNRLWDYSVMFGRERYDYPAGQEIEVLLDESRQFVGGLPFLLPGLTIGMERAWVGLTLILPYLLLGATAFRRSFDDRYVWLAGVLWAYLFLKQGPIHPPLILCAVLVVLVWNTQLWLSVPMIIVASGFATVSRYTWTFAPILWFLQLEASTLLGEKLNNLELNLKIRSFLKIIGSVIIIIILMLLFFPELQLSPQGIYEQITQQALLWYRLLPNATYRMGILIGLTVAVLPLGIVLGCFLKTGSRELNTWQKWGMILPLPAFLVVGLIVSTKIGGGGDLHNMDMFLIGMFFVGAVTFYHGGREWLLRSGDERLWVQVVLVLMFTIPGLGPLHDMRSYGHSGYGPWLVALTDVSNERGLDMYPSEEQVSAALNDIQSAVDEAREDGDVLFMDQRQLLTFGYIENVSLVPAYDKKVLIEKAMTRDEIYFQQFYRDLEEHSFSLIIVQPLNTPRKGGEYEFGEENNSWVKWVADPLLCFYEIKQTLTDVNVQLLVPRPGMPDCSEVLP